MPGSAGIGSAVATDGREPAGLTDPAARVPPVASRSTRRFALVWLVTALAWVVCLPFLTFGWINRYEDDEAAFIDGLYVRKGVALRRGLARAAASGKPLVVVVGGSGALLGIDAELIERKLGVPAVNFATHAGPGGEYLLDRAERDLSGLRPGDAVLLCPEYQIWRDPDAGTFTDLGWAYACSYDKQFLLRLDRRRLVRTLYSVPVADYGTALSGWVARARGRHYHTRPVYDLSTVGPNGDFRATLPRDHGWATAPGYPFPDVSPAGCVAHFRRFAAWAREKQLRVLFTWPNMARPGVPLPTGADQPPAALAALLRELGFVVLDSPSETAYPRASFMDTAYHADAACRQLRTEQLIGRLQPHLGLPLHVASEETRDTAATLPDWLRRYDRHVFLLAEGGPSGSFEVVGTGPWQFLRRQATGRLETDLRSLTGRPVPQLRIVFAPPGPDGRCELRVNRRARAVASAGETAAVVIDPEMGTVVDAGTFSAGAGGR
jgi:hypothetical protein